MNGKYPPWNAHGDYSNEVVYGSKTPQECQELANTNNGSEHHGEETTRVNYGEESKTISRTIWPHVSEQKEPDKMRSIQSAGNASSYTCCASKAFPSNCQGIAGDSVHYSCYPVNHRPTRSDMDHDSEDYGERTAAKRKEGYNLVNDHLTTASTNTSHILVQEKNQDLEKDSSSNWTSVIKEALEMSNGMGLEQDLFCKTSMVYEEPHSETRGMEHVKDHFGFVDYKWPNGNEKYKTGEMNGNQESSVNVLSDGTKVSPIGSNQGVKLMEVNSLTDVSSMNDNVLKRATSRTLEQYNITEISSLKQHVSTEQKDVSGYLESSPIRSITEGQSESLVKHKSMIPSTSSDIRGNREGTLSSAASLLRPAPKEHANAYEDVGPRMSVNSQTKLCEEYCPEASNATLPKDFHVPGQNVKFQVTQRLNFEHHSPNVDDDFDPKGQHECTGSGMQIKLSNTENQEAGVSHNGLVMMEETRCSTITEQTSKGGSQHFRSKHNVQKAFNKFNSASAEPSSVCSSTSVSKLENLVHNLYKVVSPTPTLKSTEPFQLRTDSTNVHVVECEASNLPPRQDGSFRMTSNAECTPTKAATSTRNPACSAVGSPQKEVKRQMMPNKRETADAFIHSEKIANACSLQPSRSIAQEHNLFQDSASQITEDLPQMSNKPGRSPRKKTVHSNTQEFPQPDSFKNGHGQSQKITCESTESSDYRSKTNLESLSLRKEGHTEYQGVCPATDVPQRTRKKARKTKKRKMVPDKENGQILNTPCGQSVKSCGLPQASHLPEEQLHNAIKSQTTAQKCGAIALTDKEEKDEEQSGIKHQIPPENAVLVSEDRVPERSQSISQKKRNRPSLVSQDCLSLVPTSDAQGTVNAKTHAKKAKSKTSSHVIGNMEEKPPPCDISKSLDLSFSPSFSVSVSDKSLSSQNTIKKFKKRKKSKNKMPPPGCTQKCSNVSKDRVSASDFLFDEVNSTPDVQNPGSRYSNKDAESISATSQAKSEINVPTQVHMNACSVPNTLKKAKNSRRRNLKKLKKTPVQRPQTSHIALTNLHGSDVPQGVVKTPDLEDLSILKTPEEHRSGQKGKAVNEKVKKTQKITANSRINDACLFPENTSSSELQNTFQPVSDIKTEPEEVKDYSKKLKHQGESTSKTQSDKNVKLEPDTISQGEFPVRDCDNVPLKHHSPKLVKQKQKIDCLKNIKARVMRRKRTGRSFKKRKLLKLTKLLPVVQETSENTTAQDPQEISQNDLPIDLVKVEVKCTECKEVQTGVSVDSSGKASMQTHSSISKGFSDQCKSPEHEQAIVTHSVATVGSVERGHFTSNAFDSARKRSLGKPPKKHRESKRSEASAAQTALLHKAEKRQCRKSTLLTTAIAGGFESGIPEHRISKPQGLHTHTKKKGKMSKLQLRNLCVLSARHSSRLSKFTLGSVRRHQKRGHTAADASSSSIRQPALSQEVHPRGPVKPRRHIKKKRGTKKSSTPLHKSSCDITNSCHLTAAHEGKDESSSVPHTLRSHHLKTSKKNVVQEATSISPKRRKLNHEVITCHQALVADPELLENCSSAMMMSSHAEIQEAKCDQMRDSLKQTPLVAECGDNPGVKTKSKTKRKMSELNTGQASKRKAPSKTGNFLDCFEGPLKTDPPNEQRNLRDVEISSAEDLCADKSKTLLRTAVEEVHFALSTNVSPESKDRGVKQRECEARWAKKERKTAFELALEAFLNTTGFYSSENTDAICDKKRKKERSEKAVRASAEAGTVNSLSRLKVASEDVSLQNSESQDCNVDCMATLNLGPCIVEADVKNKKVESLSKEPAKKCIVCKYCGQYFRHISAYTVHQRIHTGEKPYRCKLCGKNFAHLSKLKSHRKIHTQTVTLCCPCCSKTFSHKNCLIAHFKIHIQESNTSNELSQEIQRKLSNTSLDSLKKEQSDSSLICKTCEENFPNSFRLRIHKHKEPLSCRTCGKQFEKSSRLQVHERTHWPVKPYACSICAKGFNRLKALKKHSQEHTGETPFSCSNCSHAFRDLAALRVHQVSKQCSIKGEFNGDNNGDIEGFLVGQEVNGQVNTPVFFKCQICRQLYRKWCQYTLHLQTHTKFPPYLCFACGQSYEKDSEVSVHCKVCCQSSGEETACGASLSEIFHNEAQNYTSTSQSNSHLSCSGSLQTSQSKSSSMSDAGKPEENSQTPSNPSQRTGHLTLQTSEVIEASSSHEIGHIPKDVGQLAISLHSAPPSPTPSVMTCVSSDDSLECTEISPSLWRFECSRCGQRFKQYRSLCAHMQSHAPGFRNVCGHCGQSFERWNRLWLHQRIHCGKGRCYSCSQCSLQFRFFGSYKAHMLNHAGERPFACPLCPETFVREEGLHAHQCEAHKPSTILQCEVCAKTFSNLRNLLKHSRLHNGAVSHRCLSCELSFTNNKILQEHLKTHNTSLGLPLPDLPSEPLAFPHKCKRCKASFSTGDLLYAHQTCHFRRQVSPFHINEPPLSMLREKAHTETPLPSTTRPLISTLNLDTVPNDKSLYNYPHPDKLYVTPSLSRIRLPIINLDSDDENPLPASSPHALPNISTPVSGHSLQRRPESTRTSSETDAPHLPQGLQSPEPTPVQSQPDDCTITSKAEYNPIQNSVTQAIHFVETTVFLEDPSTFEKAEKYGDLDESFECPECSYKTSSILGLHEHYFLRALGNRCPTPQMKRFL